MIIKKFQAKTEAGAVEAAKKELGDNVVVMNVKSVKRKGFYRIFGFQMTEVTVAKEEESERQDRREEAVKSISSILMPDKTDKAPQFSLFTDDLIARTEADWQGKADPSKGIEEKLDSLQSLLEKQLQKPEEEAKPPEEPEKPNENVVFMQLLYNTMLENEVKECYANQIISEIDKVLKPNTPMDTILSSVYQKMILKFGKPDGIAPGKGKPKIIFFVGPTGVGKTTTIAKIASKFSVDEKKKIVLLTADTYRIAAAEQLRTYAGILNVPFRVIYTAQELSDTIRDYSDSDYILVDTAGHSHNNERQKESIGELLKSVPEEMEKEVFLVLSATTKYRDLTGIADAYSTLVKYKIIFTKVDETETLGNLLNLRLHTGAPLAYVTFGQNVPDDIENFNPQKTVKLLLGGKR